MLFKLLATSLLLIATEHSSISVTKTHISNAVNISGEKNIETLALLIAIASIETEHMDIDYPLCDNKSGEACNIGIYKMNLFQRKKACPKIPIQQINTNIEIATECMISGIKLYGLDLWLSWHRGGEGWSNYNQEVQEYKDAVVIIKNKYLHNKESLKNNTRYTIDLPAI